MFRFFSAWVLYPMAERHLGRKIREKTSLVRRQMSASFPERRANARTCLATQLERAASDVPYYRDLFRQIHFDPLKLSIDLAYLQDLPFLTKDIIREQGDRLLSERYEPGQLHLRSSGGSTGPSAKFYYSSEALDWTAAVNLVSLEWAGKHRHMREMHLASRFPETFPLRDRLKEHVKCAVLNRTNLFTDQFDPPALDRAWRRIRRARPFLLQGHPSTLYAIALRLRDRGTKATGVIRVFESTGEVLDKRKRETIETVFGCQAIDRYGSAEFGVLAHEEIGQPGRLKVLDCVAWPEVAAREGRSELVFTGMLNDAMPLVRYRTGDVAELELTEQGYYLHNIVGRTHDVIRIGGHQYPTHYLQDVFDRIGGVDEFQVVQTGNASLLRLVVPDEQHREAVAQRVHSWWGDDLQLEFTDFEGLVRRGWRSKFRHLIDASSADDAQHVPESTTKQTQAA